MILQEQDAYHSERSATFKRVFDGSGGFAVLTLQLLVQFAVRLVDEGDVFLLLESSSTMEVLALGALLCQLRHHRIHAFSVRFESADGSRVLFSEKFLAHGFFLRFICLPTKGGIFRPSFKA